MQYIKLKYQTDEVDLFSDDDMDGDIQPIPREDYERLIEFLQNYNPPAILPIQIAYYAGLRIGEARSEERRVGKECRSRWSPYH